MQVFMKWCQLQRNLVSNFINYGNNLIFNLKFILELKSSRKALIIGIVLVTVNQLCGCFAFINYTAEIFQQSGSSLSPNMSAIIIAAIQLAGSVISIFIVEKITRKLLYSLSCCGTIIGLLSFGLHGMLRTFYDVANFNWVPVVSMSFVIFIASVGIMPLTFTMLAEILPSRVNTIKNDGIAE